ncbi:MULTISPECIES: cytochrome c-type biogenesis protein [Thalassospira]|jgi:cytochrome c-type biogenesis protein CcmH|uniref:Cytochrome c-type biogenesis protein n=1 Tax=Thalassospira povalilytica TaxID=732237 RepID=A0A8I1SIW7_9PROT|nr:MULTISPECIES: cytochrome c-type biogenesis protein [Thalassospira]MEE3047220.1 cytochrome c-type biogenesis protein [Pseudomonadota bacterium]RCK26642.1 cytochrome C biogenesis protein CcmH [Thalassospira profundimaris]MBN8195806.1 cytochrome c-type biogenesis protein CcmH [Thalassospira povalilytica]MBO6769858.1 cytochrome c-type biogenesis protein CcmH [Thalassospira sp.]URK17230.1 cytochrome c-type biogenesis protein CcmH [Thalassospira sp. GO-4]
MTRRLLTMIGAFGLVVGLMAGTPAWAVNPDEMLSNPVLEKRARDISQELRCLVCQNQSIDDSDAELARDLRVLVRERLIAGDTNEEAIDYIVARYGDYVLLNPPLKPETYILWASPAVLAILALLAVFAFYRRKQREASNATTSLSRDEQARLDEILGTSNGDKKS